MTVAATITAAAAPSPARAGRHLLVAGSFAPSLVGFRGPLIADLHRAGWRVTACAPDIPDALARQLAELGAMAVDVPLSRTGLDLRADLAYRNAIARLIRSNGIDAVLSYTIKPNIWCAFAARDCGVPSVAMLTGLGYAFTDGAERAGLRQRLVHQAARLLYRRATNSNARVIFQNGDDLNDFVAAGCLGDPSKARMVAGSGIDLDQYPAVPVPAGTRFLMIARLLRNKGVREYGEAAVRLLRRRSDVTFDLVGFADEGLDGIDPADLRRWQDAGLTYHGHQSDVRPFLADCSVYVLPSYREGTPRSVLEAMATGRAVVTSDAPGCRETVEPGRNGVLVPVADAEALTAALERLADDPATIVAMGAESRRIAERRFDVRKVNRTVMSVLDEVA